MASVGLLGNEIQCTDKDILQCHCAKRIRLILSQYSNIINDTNNIKNTKSDDIINDEVNLFMNTKLGNGSYSNTKLLNDFLHLKQFHHTNNDHKQFEIMYNYLTENNIVKPCDMNQCSTLRRHYRNRTQSLQRSPIIVQPSSTKKTHRRYTMDLVSRIHVFFMHSYNINMLTSNERKYIE
eukprot:46218_1